MMSSINEFLGFNPQETEAAESFEGRQEPIPNGQYKAVATSARRKHTKKGDGWFWEIVFTLIEGEHEGHTITHRFNMSNPSEDAVLIGRSQMKRYLDCIGNLEPKDEDALCNIAVLITVANKKSTYTNRSGEQTTGINSEIIKIDPLAEDAPKAVPEQSQSAPWKRA